MWIVATVFVAAFQATAGLAQPPAAPSSLITLPGLAASGEQQLNEAVSGWADVPQGAVPTEMPVDVMGMERLFEPPRWFAGASGLIMTRTLPPGATTSILPGVGSVLSTSDASATWPGGVDLRLGRWFGPRQHHAVELIYWGFYNLGSTATVTDPNNGLMRSHRPRA
jgi:hypothetical protein